VHHTHQKVRWRAIELARPGDKPAAMLAKDLGISESCLRNWMAQADTERVAVPRG
jgi:transposase